MSFGDIPRRRAARGLGQASQTSLATAAAPARAATEEVKRFEAEVRAEQARQTKLEQRKARLDGQTAIAEAANVLAAEFAGDANPDVGAYEARFQEATRPILDAITDEDVFDEVSAFADRTRTTRSGELQSRLAKNAQQQRAASVVANVRALEITYGLCGEEDDQCRINALGEINTNIGLAVAEGDMSPAVAQTLKSASARRRSGAYARALINQNAAAAVEALDGDDNPFLRDMLPEQREILLAQAQRRVLQNEDRAEKALREERIEENFETRLSLAREIDVATPLDRQDVQDRIKQALRDRSITAPQAHAQSRALDARMEEYEDGIAGMAVLQARIAGDFGMPLDRSNPDVQDRWDEIYRGTILPLQDELAKSGDERLIAQGNAALARAVGRAGFYPDTLEGFTTDGLTSQNPGRFKEAAEMYDAVSAQPNGQVINEAAFSSLERMSMRMFNARLDGGASESDALTDTFSLMGQAESLKDLNKATWIKEKYAEDAESHLMSALGSGFFPDFGRELGTVPRLMIADYVQNVRALFLAGGGRDFKAAEAAGLEDIRGRWHLSETGTGGNAAWRVKAPELEYRVEGAPSGWHEEQLLQEIRDILKDPDLPPESVRIEADSMTSLEEQPAYTAFVLDEHGQRRDIVDPETFEHLAWRPEWLSSPAATRMAAAMVAGQADNEQTLVDARAERRHFAENPVDWWKMQVGGVSIPIPLNVRPLSPRERRSIMGNSDLSFRAVTDSRERERQAILNAEKDLAEFPMRALRFIVKGQ
jgi:hypothetical protein